MTRTSRITPLTHVSSRGLRYALRNRTLNMCANAVKIIIIGKPLMIFLRGGEEVTGATLTRFFGFHVAVLPGLATLLIFVHLLLVQRLGISVPPKLEVEWTVNPAAK